MANKAGVLSIQLKPVLKQKHVNLEAVKRIMEGYCDKKLDLVVLPEFFSTGISQDAFVNEPEDTNGGEVVAELSRIAKRFDTNIVCGTVIERDGDKLYNTSFVLDRGGKIVGKYRKIHLYRFFGGQEHTYITPGTETVVADLDFGRVGLSVCFDIKYPLMYKKLIKAGAEVIVSPSAWCNLNAVSDTDKENFAECWRAMNICRAAENLVYFVSSNPTGKVDNFIYCAGNSMIVNPMGVVEANACEEEGGIYCEIDLDLVRELKQTVPVADID